MVTETINTKTFLAELTMKLSWPPMTFVRSHWDSINVIVEEKTKLENWKPLKAICSRCCPHTDTNFEALRRVGDRDGGGGWASQGVRTVTILCKKSHTEHGRRCVCKGGRAAPWLCWPNINTEGIHWGRCRFWEEIIQQGGARTMYGKKNKGGRVYRQCKEGIERRAGGGLGTEIDVCCVCVCGGGREGLPNHDLDQPSIPPRPASRICILFL